MKEPKVNMFCPKCNEFCSDDSLFCEKCGSKLIMEEIKCHAKPKSNSGFRTMDSLIDEEQEITGKKIDGIQVERKVPVRNESMHLGHVCNHCGKKIPKESEFCQHCGKQLTQVPVVHTPTPKTPSNKKWLIATICCVVLLIGILLIPWGNLGQTEMISGGNEHNTYVPPLSETCDYVLCRGTDISGNTYELVANQTESALGYEITVGVIKNNEWLYPLSADFPFLQDGLFHVSVSLAGESGTSLTNPNSVIKNLYFIDTGAFLMDSYIEDDSWVDTSDHMNIIFSCTTLESYTVDCEEYGICYLEAEPKFSDGNVVSYGYISTDNGKILIYHETSGTTSGWRSDHIYDWCTIDTKTLNVDTFARDMAGVHPTSVLAEGLFFATDKCFYDTTGKKVIDLSVYNIDMWYDDGIYFEDGTCSFKVTNQLGTEFIITIDKSGNVISEVEA